MLKKLDDIFTSVVVTIIFIACIFLLPIYILIADWSDDCYQCPFGIGSYNCENCSIHKRKIRKNKKKGKKKVK